MIKLPFELVPITLSVPPKGHCRVYWFAVMDDKKVYGNALEFTERNPFKGENKYPANIWAKNLTETMNKVGDGTAKQYE